ncbi:probable L-arabinitol 4-dehydrogenase [Ramularia collo-cygni]|uniref:Probable L-arabinitol 4-dehydrogenase n=1 Tax=Ramularia collo-cygni TaxID=112498 RepID=A0A2D3UZY6_9PEZI|nr:probable L-arabinitol 4-dehydrogenase [Ramularia collo-cygni]CZT18800.1 probable L-arabinitol 4-dehydrogenase [Ramularia collo-cygni]
MHALTSSCGDISAYMYKLQVRELSSPHRPAHLPRLVMSDILTRKPKNIAISTNPSHDLNILETDIPYLQPNECLIHVRATGICGSDVHFWKHGNIGSSIITTDCGLGHESAGIIIKTGSAVEKFNVGDRVALECGIPCSKPTCRACRTGQYHGCPEMVFYSSPPINGTLRRYHAHPEAWLHKLPDHVTFEEGALLEPLSVALAGIERSGLKLGDPLVICGAGPIGMVTLLAANAAGAAPIVITDLDENRLRVAKELVPRVRTVQVERGEDSQLLAEKMKLALGQEAKLVIECTGVESSVHAGVYATRFGGCVFVIGVGHASNMEIPFMHASFREIDIRFQFRYRETYPKGIMLLQEGLIDLKPLVTHRFTLEQAKEAFTAASTPAARAIKVQLLDD